MAYNFALLKQKIKEVEDRLTQEFGSIRTGRATPVILDSVLVDSYGSKMSVNKVANISIEGARSLRVTPWDKGLIKEIEKGIALANLGLSTAADEEGLRVMFPELTSERRLQLVRAARDKLEEGRIHLRTEREKIWSDIQKQERESKISEDEKFRAKDEMQKLVDGGNKKMEEMFEKKEKEITA